MKELVLPHLMLHTLSLILGEYLLQLDDLLLLVLHICPDLVEIWSHRLLQSQGFHLVLVLHDPFLQPHLLPLGLREFPSNLLDLREYFHSYELVAPHDL